jgi:hypothetical protein
MEDEMKSKSLDPTAKYREWFPLFRAAVLDAFPKGTRVTDDYGGMIYVCRTKGCELMAIQSDNETREWVAYPNLENDEAMAKAVVKTGVSESFPDTAGVAKIVAVLIDLSAKY